MNKVLYSLISLLALTSCANTYNIQGTSNVSTLDGRMLYLKVLKDNDFKSVDSCDVVHGQFAFSGTLDSVRMANIFMDDESVLPLVLESGDITVKINTTQQIVSGTPLNDKLFKFFTKYNQLENQKIELVHRHDRGLMNGDDELVMNRRLNAEAIHISEQEDKLITSFVTENFDNVLHAHHRQRVSHALAVDRRHHEQGHRQFQERPIRERLLSEGAGERTDHERNEGDSGHFRSHPHPSGSPHRFCTYTQRIGQAGSIGRLMAEPNN